MNRVFMYLSALVGIGGIAFLAASTQAQGPPAAAPVAAAQVRPTMAVFNIAKVMREYGKAKYKGYELNKKAMEMTGNLGKWKSDYTELQNKLRGTNDPKIKADLEKALTDLTRKVQDKDAEIKKAYQDEASVIISTLYDEIKSVVDKTAEMNGYHVVFIYRDASSPDEAKSVGVKEMRITPAAAFPFYVSSNVDITQVVITTLNAWFPSPPVPADAKTQAPPPGPPPGPAPTPGQPPQR